MSSTRLLPGSSSSPQSPTSPFSLTQRQPRCPGLAYDSYFRSVHYLSVWSISLTRQQAALTERHGFESTIQGLEVAARVITRYAVVEALYRRTTSVIHDELQAKLSSLYSHVLLFLAKGVRYFSLPTAGE